MVIDLSVVRLAQDAQPAANTVRCYAANCVDRCCGAGYADFVIDKICNFDTFVWVSTVIKSSEIAHEMTAQNKDTGSRQRRAS